ncbi:MAG: ribonuclease T [Gammaproteobacteria bacterium]|nr:ribonuclease T [Gammaproteobacteria bacterium]
METMDSPAPVAGKGVVAGRFRGFLPVVVDVETGGFNARTDALLEVAAVIVGPDEEGVWRRQATHACHVEPFSGANIEKAALEFTGIDPYHPFRGAVSEAEALRTVFQPIRAAIKAAGCSRAVLVGHNPAFDLGFINEAVKRTSTKRNPFHPFSSFDTATLGGLAFGQTVLARAVQAAGMEWESGSAHSAIYDAERTADLFCAIVNLWDHHIGIEP